MNSTAAAAPPQSPLSGTFRHAMRQLASGVSVVTHADGEHRTGLTATSVSSLSVDPPSLVVCVNRAASLYARLKVGDLFGVNVLGAQHAEIADRFAGRHGLQGPDRFREGRWSTSPEGVLLLADALASFTCEVEEVVGRHSHAILIGRVRDATFEAAGGALLYWRGAYDGLGWSDEEIRRATGMTPPCSKSATVLPFRE